MSAVFVAGMSSGLIKASAPVIASNLLTMIAPSMIGNLVASFVSAIIRKMIPSLRGRVVHPSRPHICRTPRLGDQLFDFGNHLIFSMFGNDCIVNEILNDERCTFLGVLAKDLDQVHAEGDDAALSRCAVCASGEAREIFFLGGFHLL